MPSEAALHPPNPAREATAPPPKRRVALLVVVGLILAGAGVVWFARPWARSSRAAGGASPSASARAGAPQVIAVEGLLLAARPVKVTVAGVGSLAANESVPITAELQRRVVRALAVDGARVKKGDVLFKLDDADLQAQARELQVRRKLLVDGEARQKKLLAQGLASIADYEHARTDLDLLDAQVGSLSVTLSRTTVRAPFDGRLGLRNVSEGTVVAPQTTLVTLQDDARIKVDFTLPERYASFVTAGQVFTFRIAGKEKPFEAKVAAVEPAIEAASRSLRVRGIIENPTGELMVGGFVTVQFPLESQEGGLLVPSIAVIPSLGGHGVWIAKDGKASLVEVEIGVRTDTEVQVTKGLAAGDVVVTTNLLRLRPGVEVKVVKVAQ